MEFGGQVFWLVLLTFGVAVLAGAMIFGTMRNRQRTPSERVRTEVETKREYDREDRDDS